MSTHFVPDMSFLGVNPAFQDQGVGKHLLDFVVAESISMGVPLMTEIGKSSSMSPLRSRYLLIRLRLSQLLPMGNHRTTTPSRIIPLTRSPQPSPFSSIPDKRSRQKKAGGGSKVS